MTNNIGTAPEVAGGITRDFTAGHLDLSARPNAPLVGWESMPELVAVSKLKQMGANESDVRLFLTLVMALDRARDSEFLWRTAPILFESEPWLFQPAQIVTRAVSGVRALLKKHGVSQRHGPDSDAWLRISQALLDSAAPKTVRDAVFVGEGDTVALLRDVTLRDSVGNAWFPLLRGPKVSPVWIRMLALPGEASIANLDALPVAVDVQVRKVTEYLGIASTEGLELEMARPLIQKAWQSAASHVVAPAPLAGTLAGLDPALWFFAHWGCTHCQRAGGQIPIRSVCSACSL